MLKIKKEKKVLDQRVKNLQFTQSKEVETLKKKLKETSDENKVLTDQIETLN